MKCGEIESDLLLHGLGELGFWRSWSLSLHLSRCARCRKAQNQLLQAARGLAAALAPPGGAPRTGKPPVSVAHGWLSVAVLAVLMSGLLLLGGFTAARMRAHPPAQEVPCRPDLPNDQCR